MFEGIEDVKSKRKSIYIPRTAGGKYKLKISAMKTGKRANVFPYSVVEFSVLESNQADAPVKSTVSWYVEVNKYPNIALAEMRNFLESACEIPADKIKRPFVDQLFAEQMFVGKVIDLHVTNRTTAKGAVVAEMNWTPAA